MMFAKWSVVLTLALIGMEAPAQVRILEPSAGKNASVDLYDVPGAAQPFKKIPAEQAGFPLQVLAAEGGYRQVRIGNETVWVKSVQMRFEKEGAGSCVGVVASAGSALGTPGAATGCGK